MEKTSSIAEPIPFGKYLLTEEIAVGGMAEIYKAVALGADGKPFSLAIKRILPQFSTDEEFVSMLVDEAKVMVLLNHPNIVPIIEFGMVEGSYYIAMDYVHGVTLKDLFKTVRLQNQMFSIDMAVHIVREVGSGLSYAHRKVDESGKPLNIVHRDISPANILISYDGDVRVADFGISKAANQSHRTQIGIIRGKTGYMSPEQTRANSILDQRSDIYALGIILWELLTGERLYRADSIPEALKMIRESKVPPMKNFRPDVPLELEAIVLKALSPQIEGRWERAEHLVDALNEFMTRWSPKGRPLRVTHSDLSGFLRRFYKEQFPDKEVAVDPHLFDNAKTQVETGVFAQNPKTVTKTAPTKPKTIASNPLYELSEPEYNLPKEPTQAGKTKTTSGSFRSRPTVVSQPRYQDAVGDVEIERQGRPILMWMIFGGALLGGLAGWIWLRSRGHSITPQTPVVQSNPTFIPTKVVPNDEPTSPPAEVLTKAIVEILTDPPGAKVYFSGQELADRTPVTLPPLELGKDYALRLSKPGYKFREVVISRTRAEKSSETFILMPADSRVSSTAPSVATPRPITGPSELGSKGRGSTVSIKTNPWCEIVVDGKSVGTSPVVNLELDSGFSHKIRYVPDHNLYALKPFEYLLKPKANKSYLCVFDFQSPKKDHCKEK